MRKFFSFLVAAALVSFAATSCNDPKPEGTPEFDITFATIANGSAVAMIGDAQVTKAKAGDVVTVVGTPVSSEYVLAGFAAYPVVTFNAGANANTRTFTMPESAVEISATFAKGEFALTWAADPTAGGTITVTVDGETIESGDMVEVGATVNVEAETDPAYTWENWTATPTVAWSSTTGSAAAETSFTMPGSAVALTANFELIPKYSITFTAPQNGTLVVTVDSDEITTGDEFVEGTEVHVVATPATGYLFGAWTVTGISTDNTTGTFDFEVGTENITLTFTVTEAPKSVEIGGAKWALYNVGAPGEFVSQIHEIGGYYQFNKTVAWMPNAAGDGVVPTPSTGEWYRIGEAPYGWGGGDGNTPTNDPYGVGPCPEGFTLPTLAQWSAFRDAVTITNTFAEIGGVKVKVLVSKTNPDVSLTLPIAGTIMVAGASPSPDPVMPMQVGASVYYWANDKGGPTWTGSDNHCYGSAVSWGPTSMSMSQNNTTRRELGCPVRCVEIAE